MKGQGLSPEWMSFLRMQQAIEQAAYEIAFRSGPNWYAAAAYFLEVLEEKVSDPAMAKELLEEVRDSISFRLQEGHWS